MKSKNNHKRKKKKKLRKRRKSEASILIGNHTFILHRGLSPRIKTRINLGIQIVDQHFMMQSPFFIINSHAPLIWRSHIFSISLQCSDILLSHFLLLSSIYVFFFQQNINSIFFWRCLSFFFLINREAGKNQQKEIEKKSTKNK